MKFLVILSLLALSAADEDTKNIQDKKSQQFDINQNTGSSPQPSLANNQAFPPTSFANVFGTSEPISTLAYTGYNGNVSPIQTINPDFFVTPGTGPINAPIQAFPITRTVLPSGTQPVFPVAGNVFPGAQAVQSVPIAVNPIPSQYQGVGSGILTVPTGAFDANNAGSVPLAAYRFPESISSLTPQGLSTIQQVGLAAIPAFTSGLLPSLSNGVLQGQNIPAGIQQVLKNPASTPASISSVASGPLTSAFRNA